MCSTKVKELPKFIYPVESYTHSNNNVTMKMKLHRTNIFRLHLMWPPLACKMVNKKSRECHNHELQPTPTPRRRQEGRKSTRAKLTNALEAHRPVLPSPSVVLTARKGLKNMRTKSKARLNIKRLVVKSHKAKQSKNNTRNAALES